MYTLYMIWLHLGWVGAAAEWQPPNFTNYQCSVCATYQIHFSVEICRKASLMAPSTRVPVSGRRADFSANFAVISRVRAPSVLSAQSLRPSTTSYGCGKAGHKKVCLSQKYSPTSQDVCLIDIHAETFRWIALRICCRPTLQSSSQISNVVGAVVIGISDRASLLIARGTDKNDTSVSRCSAVPRQWSNWHFYAHWVNSLIQLTNLFSEMVLRIQKAIIQFPCMQGVINSSQYHSCSFPIMSEQIEDSLGDKLSDGRR